MGVLQPYNGASVPAESNRFIATDLDPGIKLSREAKKKRSKPPPHKLSANEPQCLLLLNAHGERERESRINIPNTIQSMFFYAGPMIP